MHCSCMHARHGMSHAEATVAAVSTKWYPVLAAITHNTTPTLRPHPACLPPCRFVDNYLRMVHACAERDRQGVVDMSVKLGFLTGGCGIGGGGS
jgi:hypothetical protein